MWHYCTVKETGQSKESMKTFTRIFNTCYQKYKIQGIYQKLTNTNIVNALTHCWIEFKAKQELMDKNNLEVVLLHKKWIDRCYCFGKQSQKIEDPWSFSNAWWWQTQYVHWNIWSCVRGGRNEFDTILSIYWKGAKFRCVYMTSLIFNCCRNLQS